MTSATDHAADEISRLRPTGIELAAIRYAINEMKESPRVAALLRAYLERVTGKTDSPGGV